MTLDAGALERLPPALRYRLREADKLLADPKTISQGVEKLRRLHDDATPWLGLAPSLAELGYRLLDATEPDHRLAGTVFLTLFPNAETMTRLAKVALDNTVPLAVRDQATWSLGYRQARQAHPEVLWSADAIRIADDALLTLAESATEAGRIELGQLALALRHVDDPRLFALIARAPALWAEALECYADVALAHVLFDRFAELNEQHRLRALRLAAATLGADAVPTLVKMAADAPTDERLEMLLLAITFGGEAHLPAFEATLAGMKFGDLLRQRARWHLQHPGVVPTVRGLAIARSTARIPAADRSAKSARAADDLGALTQFARHPEHYLYAMWGWMVRGSNDPARARALVAAHPESQRLVRDLYLRDLAERGRVRQLTAAAQTLEGADAGAFGLAQHGRPLAALELAATARLHTPELVATRVLGCWRAGRPDLAERVLAEDLPPSEITTDEGLAPFPGEHERWMAEHAPLVSPAITALVRGRDAVLALGQPAPTDAEPDSPSLEPLAAVLRRLGRGLPGSTVYLAGEFKYMDKDAIGVAVEKAGARLVNGPFPGTDYYVHGDWCLVQTIAQLERQGTRRLRSGELEGV